MKTAFQECDVNHFKRDTYLPDWCDLQKKM